MLYVDTSALVPVFIREARSKSVAAILRRNAGSLVVSPWVVTEAVSALQMKVRGRHLSRTQANSARARLRQTISANFQVEPIENADFERAAHLMESGTSPLRASDALHLAICIRLGVALLTLDHEMAEAGKELGLSVESLTP